MCVATSSAARCSLPLADARAARGAVAEYRKGFKITPIN